MKKHVFAISVILLLFLLSGCSVPKSDVLRFVTGGESGTYYAFGTVIAQHATNNAGINVIGITGNGSQSNIYEIIDGSAELGFCQSDVMSYAYEGTHDFKTPLKGFSVVGALYNECIQIVTLNPEIKSPKDLAGKFVSIGSSGSGVYFNAVDILNCYGLTEDDIKPTYQSFSDSVEALKDGKIDAAFIVSGTPTTAITDLCATKDVHIISLDDEHLSKLVTASPYYKKCTIPKEYYHLKSDAHTIGVSATIIAKNSVSEDEIFKLCKDIFDNPKALKSNHSKYGEINLKYASSITSVPYHKGAEKYFKLYGFGVNQDE